MRQKYPHAKIYVHPECPQEIVAQCDGAGSTSYLIDVAEKAQKGDVLVIGTEANLVNRLADKHKNRGVTVTLEDIVAGTAKPVQIDSSLIEDAKKSLVRMLNHCAK